MKKIVFTIILACTSLMVLQAQRGQESGRIIIEREYQDENGQMVRERIIKELTPEIQDALDQTLESSIERSTEMSIGEVEQFTEKFEGQAERFGDYMEQWGESFSNDMEAWAKNFSQKMERNGISGSSSQPFLGVSYRKTIEKINNNGESSTQTNEYMTVINGSAADKAGLQDGDQIIGINEVEILNFDDIASEISHYDVGDIITIDYIRDGQQASTTATLTARKSNTSPRHRHTHIQRSFQDDDTQGYLGIMPNPQNDEASGATIFVAENTPALEAGLQDGDQITAINGATIHTFGDISEVLEGMPPGTTVQLEYLRDGTTHTQDITLGKHFARSIIEEMTSELPEQLSKMGFDIDEEDIQIDIDDWQYDETEDTSNKIKRLRFIVLEDYPSEYSNNGSSTLEVDEFMLFPNPVGEQLTLSFTAEALPTTIRIIDQNGTAVYHMQVNDFNGTFRDDLTINSLPSGTYILEIIQEEQVMAKAFQVSR